ncbi:MAG: MBL fold metallo-hydrolase [Bacteroidales bacterium]|nr:MBL fold metallo-hydrolase [Bacteroidales bacterium]
MLNIKCFYFNSFQECCSVVWDGSGKAAIIDPGCYTPEEIQTLTGFISSKGLTVEKIMLTHTHFDHIYGVAELARLYNVPVLMDPAETAIIENEEHFCNMFGLRVPDTGFQATDIHDGDLVYAGENTFEVLSTPGHTPGGVCFLCREEKVLFSGDTLFAGSIGRTDNRWGDYDALMKGIFEKLMVLEGDITVIPGHGHPTTIADERMKNPFLQPFNEPYEDAE